MMEIKKRFSGDVIFRSEAAKTLGEAVVELVQAARDQGARANLAGADLAGADLAGADLADQPEPYERVTDAAGLARRLARFRERHPEVPVIAQLDQKILERVESGGRLDMSAWHTTHCRAGWAIVLAGEAGAALEAEYGPHRAGAMIYRASTGRVPHFYAPNDRAMEDIRRCAAEAQ